MSLKIARSVVLMFPGNSYNACADRLSLSVDSVWLHVRQIYDQLHVHSKSEAVRKAMKHGWLL